jgi:hypothetical protein
LAAAVQVNNAAMKTNGVTALQTDTVVTMPAAATKLWLGGSHFAGEVHNGHLRAFTYLPRRVSDGELQVMAA